MRGPFLLSFACTFAKGILSDSIRRRQIIARQETSQHPSSKRRQEHDALLDAALARPGVREIMEVYGQWQDKDSGLDAYRLATKTTSGQVTNSNSSSSL